MENDHSHLTHDSLALTLIDSLYKVIKLKSLYTINSTNNMTTRRFTKNIIQPNFTSRDV